MRVLGPMAILPLFLSTTLLAQGPDGKGAPLRLGAMDKDGDGKVSRAGVHRPGGKLRPSRCQQGWLHHQGGIPRGSRSRGEAGRSAGTPRPLHYRTRTADRLEDRHVQGEGRGALPWRQQRASGGARSGRPEPGPLDPAARSAGPARRRRQDRSAGDRDVQHDVGVLRVPADGRSRASQESPAGDRGRGGERHDELPDHSARIAARQEILGHRRCAGSRRPA